MCGNVGKCGGILWRVPRQQVALHLLVDSPTTQLPPTRPLSNYHANGNEEWDDESNCDSSEELLAKEFVNILRGIIELSKTVFQNSSKQLPSTRCLTNYHANCNVMRSVMMTIVCLYRTQHIRHGT